MIRGLLLGTKVTWPFTEKHSMLCSVLFLHLETIDDCRQLLLCRAGGADAHEVCAELAGEFTGLPAPRMGVAIF